MVDGNGVHDDGDEDDEEIPLPGVESRTNLTPKTKIVVAAELCIADEPPLLGLRVSSIYDGVCEKEGRDDALEAQGLGWRAQRGWARHLVPPGPRGPSRLVQKPNLLYLMKNLRGIFPRIYFLQK